MRHPPLVRDDVHRNPQLIDSTYRGGSAVYQNQVVWRRNILSGSSFDVDHTVPVEEHCGYCIVFQPAGQPDHADRPADSPRRTQPISHKPPTGIYRTVPTIRILVKRRPTARLSPAWL